MKCVVCDRRPKANGCRYCSTCEQKYQLNGNGRQRQKPEKYATYRGHVVGFFRQDNGRLRPRLLNCSPESLPKDPERVIRLDSYCQGFSRAQIKKIKAGILGLIPTAKVVKVS